MFLKRTLKPLGEATTAPWAGSGYVGRHFQEHLGCTVGRIKPGPYPELSRFFDNFYRNGIKYQPRIKASPKMQREHRMLNGVCYLVPQSRSDAALAAAKRTMRAIRSGQLQTLSPRDLAMALGGSMFQMKAAVRLAKHGRAYNPDDLGINVDLACEQSPTSSSTIKLADTVDALGERCISIDWRIERVELDSIAKMGRALVRLFRARGWPEIILDPNLEREPEAFSEKIFDTYHHMGGARMSTTACAGVVDPNLRLHGTPNGYVCSAAVFPTSGFSGPTHTVIALGVRLSDHLIALALREKNAVT